MLNALSCLEVYMIEVTLNGCLYKIIFIEYSFVIVEDGAMLNFIKINTSTSSFINNPNLKKVVLKACSLGFMHNTL